MPKSKEYVDSSDDSSSEEKEVRPTKQDKKSEEKEEKTKKKREAEEKKEKVAKKAKVESKEDDGSWDLGNNRKVIVREFKGKLLVDIREMYFDNAGDLKPGKKGIALTMAQWRKLSSIVDDINEDIKTKA